MPSSFVQTLQLLKARNGCGATDPGSFSAVSYQKSSAWSNTPGWPNVSGPIPYHAYSMSLLRRRWAYAHFTNNYNPNNECDRHHEGDAPAVAGGYGYTGGGSFLPTSAAGKADGTARLRAKDQNVNYQLFAAEIGQTYQLALTTIQRLTRAARGLRKGNLSEVSQAFTLSSRDARRVSRGVKPVDIANTWLEFQYGWKPLYNDVYNHFNKTTKHIGLGHGLHRVVGNGTSNNTLVVSGQATNAAFLWTSTVKTVEFAKTQLDFAFDPAVKQSLSSIVLGNPVSLAWELIPFSFVVDWFLPIGSFFDSLDATRGLVFSGGFRTTLKRQRVNTTLKQNAATANKWLSSASGMDTFDKVEMVRSVLTTFPKAPLPQFKSPFSSTHIANALALLSSALLSPK